MSLNGMDDLVVLPVLLGQIRTDLRMGAFHLMVNGLAQIVKQAGPLGNGHVGAHFGGHDARQMSYFDAVVQHVLAIAGTELHPA